MPYKYLEIVSYSTGKVIKRIDVSNKTSRSVNMVDMGINRNLNHNDFYTREKDSETKLDCEINTETPNKTN